MLQLPTHHYIIILVEAQNIAHNITMKEVRSLLMSSLQAEKDFVHCGLTLLNKYNSKSSTTNLSLTTTGRKIVSKFQSPLTLLAIQEMF